ncbi:nuclear transport factor 2 family protein [Mariniflexile litorale]|uniref:Nuclear transport factor 2 family protein n=1 Tax=Mariniflexile litorale TaxID=3045158 RepID=A0AAU7EDT7_9FLAO|nr:nuclear transport factor 2 family protein [Mariniflexile sp. KMM 9835]MDQ8213020.1 nuclear transport factor 2 family protein [Mariniflexile sp. KMM 9835]
MLEEDKIRQLKENLSRAIREKDAKKANKLFVKNCVLFLMAPPLMEKFDEGLEGLNNLENWFLTFENGIGLETKELEITNNSDIAFLSSLEHLTGKRTDGSETDIWFRETLGLQKIKGEWKVTHQHQSFPMHMDGTDKAATNLEP